MRRWSLPLLLAALLAASGCVTVDPSPPRPAGARSAPVPADHEHPAVPRPARLGPGTALPLSRLPEAPPATPAPANGASEPEPAPGPGRATAAGREASGEGRKAGPAPRRQDGPRRVSPRRATAPKAPARRAAKPQQKKRPHARTPAPHRPARPAPGTGGGARDMAQLCRAAHGVTSPAVAALCQQTYGR
ncbi:hypothetical protein [Streptomyces sp. NPDC046685]|uniref:hypothetical protein n=1 Tax=Streptomyces sp. NPDC046685 TaxID=3157202 RepID=UPI0033CFBFBD